MILYAALFAIALIAGAFIIQLFLVIGSAFLYGALPLLLGLLILAIGNRISRSGRCCATPTWWNILTAVVMVGTAISYWIDLADSVIHSGRPFVILLAYGVISAVFLRLLAVKARKTAAAVPAKQPFPDEAQAARFDQILFDSPERMNTTTLPRTCFGRYEDADLPETGAYLYCSVIFRAGGKPYFYKTTDGSLTPGDTVIVPVETDGETEIARIVQIDRYRHGETPYPPNLTKDILGRYPNSTFR